jgi:hypothetical protein
MLVLFDTLKTLSDMHPVLFSYCDNCRAIEQV